MYKVSPPKEEEWVGRLSELPPGVIAAVVGMEFTTTMNISSINVSHGHLGGNQAIPTKNGIPLKLTARTKSCF